VEMAGWYLDYSCSWRRHRRHDRSAQRDRDGEAESAEAGGGRPLCKPDLRLFD
jgi:hypothetical protein